MSNRKQNKTKHSISNSKIKLSTNKDGVNSIKAKANRISFGGDVNKLKNISVRMY